MQYIERLVDGQLRALLRAMGGVMVIGPKYCGKTETAKHQAQSRVNLQTDARVKVLMESDPKQLLLGETPRLLDEWQEYPKIRDYVRHEIDERQRKGQFILTGSATPHDLVEKNLHSGAGRLARMRMRPMSWVERGWSDGSVSLVDILAGKKIKGKLGEVTLGEIARRIAIGGWPALIGSSEKNALLSNRDYLENIINVDLPHLDGVKRDPVRVRKTIESYARNLATAAKISTITQDVFGAQADIALDPDTVTTYLDALRRLMIVDDLPAWNTHLRSAARLRLTPKRHLADPSLAVAALNLSSALLLKEPKYLGFLFESVVVHNLRVFADHHGAFIYYHLDSDGDEVDAIIEQPGGKFAIFEVKLGLGAVEEAVVSLNNFEAKLTTVKKKDLMSKNVIIGTGVTHVRTDGINVITLGTLGA